MILDMIPGCRYLRRSTDRWLLSKNSMTRLEGLESWHGAGLLWNCSMIPITNTKGFYLYSVSNTTPSRPRLQYLLPKTYNITSCRFRIHHQLVSFFISGPRHHALPNVSAFNRGTALLPNDDALPSPDRRRFLPNALKETSCRMVLSCQIRPICQFLPVPIFCVNILVRASEE
jgi:hypothetical protein